ncbi:MAG: hypothetical protein FJ039_09455 [Chloroflexi bacterium]|nr:hypothetical protein [Chloroflexota bacterium]
MTTVTEVFTKDAALLGREPEAALRFKADLAQGIPWLTALLEAIERWDLHAEVVGDRFYVYLVADEALDWLVLAERLLASVQGLVPVEETEALLLYGRLPSPLSADDFRRLIGPAKHRAVTNFWYGISVEEAIHLAVEREVRKSRRASGKPEETRLDEIVYERIYGAAQAELIKRFCEERKEKPPAEMSLTLMKEFTYWLFKLRLKSSDPARLASDTKKGLDLLRSLGQGALYGIP